MAQRITSQSLQNSINVMQIQAAAAQGGEAGLGPEQVVAESRRYGNHLGVEFGSVYRSTAVVPDGTQPPQLDDMPSATPGARAPHVRLGHPDSGPSTLTSSATRSPCSPRPAAAPGAALEGEVCVPIHRYRIRAAGLRDPGGFAGAYGLGDHGAVLVRPDGHVAWRGASGPASAALLRDTVEGILARQGRSRSSASDLGVESGRSIRDPD